MIPEAADDQNHMQTGDLPPGATRCGTCGTVGYRSDRYCPCCGSELPKACTECGAVIAHPIAFYCTACGSMLDPGGNGDREGAGRFPSVKKPEV